jgi:hypothetical protein
VRICKTIGESQFSAAGGVLQTRLNRCKAARLKPPKHRLAAAFGWPERTL